ncbi:MAG: hypothetical protein K8S13_19500 [Desulfobacula sp.]|uniref:hypothetical protein n=1 Tax=Desulfobacula sp. TaxID=2593537 RepID=UPI0025C5FF71|nr:hypothetical protein [Desulfobacula sp.]MCD4722024.1 hypothetical protein [Desulfobacula sp.]
MDDKLTELRAQLKEQALKDHERLSRLFIEDRFKFELERKEAIEKKLNIKNEKLRNNLIKLQKKWDDILKNSGSSHNRFVLIQMLFWDHVNDHFRPALNCFGSKKE